MTEPADQFPAPSARLPPPLPPPEPLSVQVLSYAAPLSRRNARKPIRTRILREPCPDGITFVEVSEEKTKAIIVLGCCLLPLAILAMNAYSFLSGWRIWGHIEDLAYIVITLGSALVLLGFMVAAFDQVWRRTELSARARSFSLNITSPLPLRARRRQWRADQILDLRVWAIVPATSLSEPLCELQVRLSQNQTLHLFRNYGRSELTWIHQELQRNLAPSGSPAGA